MKKSFPIIVALALISLPSLTSESVRFEQITFEYFVHDIMKSDFKDVTSFEFKGHTEESFSTLKKYKFCLAPIEKLGATIADATKGIKSKAREIDAKDTQGLKITDFQGKTDAYRLFIYPSLHIADQYYVFLTFQKQKETPVKYVFELTPSGEISRSCKMN